MDTNTAITHADALRLQRGDLVTWHHPIHGALDCEVLACQVGRQSERYLSNRKVWISLSNPLQDGRNMLLTFRYDQLTFRPNTNTSED